MKHLRHSSAQIPVLTSVLAAGTIMAAVTILLTGNILNRSTQTPEIFLQSESSADIDNPQNYTPDCDILSSDLKPSLILTESNGGKIQKIKKENIFVISLEENQTTGYKWIFTYGQDDFRLICREQSAKTDSNSSLVGAGSQTNYYFKALSSISKNPVLIADYLRTFENNPPIKTIVFEFSAE